MKKRVRFYLIVIVMAIVVALLTGTYAYFSVSVSSSNNAISGSIANVKISMNVKLLTKDDKLIPLKESLLNEAAKAQCQDSNGYTACQIYSITVNNEGSVKVNVDGYVTLTSSTSKNLKWTELSTQTSYGSAKKRGMKRSSLVKQDSIKAKSSKTYYIMVYLNDTNTEQNDIDKGSFNGIVEFNTGSNSLSKPLDSTVSLFDDTVTLDYELDNNIDFSKISSDTNGKGLYMLNSTASDEHPIYYYRGAVTNNNVLFAGFCWKIIRTTDTGGIKMIYNGTPSNNQCTNTTGESTQIGTSAFNSNGSAADVGYMYGTRYVSSTKDMSSVTDAYYYGNDITYSNGKYTLIDTMTSTSWLTDKAKIAKKYHYTCLSTSNTCTNVYYINWYGNEEDYKNNIYYITLTGGKNIDDAKMEMFTNTNNSKIKTVIDNWYKTNMTSYTSKLEDTVYCNDRTIISGPLKGKDEDSSSQVWTMFGTRSRLNAFKPSLECNNVADKFTVSDSIGNGKLTYPVGLITADEITYAGGRIWTENTSYYLYTSQYWWSGSPNDFGSAFAGVWDVYSAGYFGDYGVGRGIGVRPVVSLASTNQVSSGSGTSTEPYVVAE